jgi:hypothetical protein
MPPGIFDGTGQHSSSRGARQELHRCERHGAWCVLQRDALRDHAYASGSNIFMCGSKNEVQMFVGSATSAAAYDICTGVFQFDDKNVCLSKNPATDTCTCDASSVKLTMLRANVDDGLPGSFKGSNIQSCGAAASASGIALSSDLYQVTGMYQHDDPVDKSEGCRSINPFTGNCS